MIGYTTIGTNDLQVAGAFYDSVLGQLGATRCRSETHLVGWQFPAGGSQFYVLKPFDGKHAEPGNGPMLALYAGSRDLVNAVYAAAIKCGASDEGRPGPRDYSAGFYAGYFRDPSGNKLNVYCIEPSSVSEGLAPESDA